MRTVLHPTSDHKLTFSRLAQVPLASLIDHMSDPRLARHMPLLTQPFDANAAQHFVNAKEACWQRDGLGHWAILSDGRYVGWGGFQKEGLIGILALFSVGMPLALVSRSHARRWTSPAPTRASLTSLSCCRPPAAVSVCCPGSARDRLARFSMRARAFSSFVSTPRAPAHQPRGPSERIIDDHH